MWVHLGGLSCVVLCKVSLDGNSLKAAELLFKSGFKEAYGIKGGVAGKKGWLVSLTFSLLLLCYMFCTNL